MKFSIIIPIHNEEKYLEKFLFDLLKKLKNFSDYEIILVENGSADQTRKLAREICKKKKQVRMLTLPEGNYGLAVKKGFLSAKGEYLVLFDLDYYDVGFMKKAFKLMGKADAVVGTKSGKGSSDQRSFLRKFVSRGFTFILKIFFSLKISDTHGIKVLDRKKFLSLIKKCVMTKEIFDTELLIRGQHKGLKLDEIGVRVEEKRQSRSSIINRAFRSIRDLVLLKTHLIKEKQTSDSREKISLIKRGLPLILLTISLITLLPSLSLPFSLIDDTEAIKRSEILSQQFSGGDFSQTGWIFLEPTTGRTRPFYWIFFYVRYLLFGQNPFFFHLSDIFISIGILFSLYYLVKRISSSSWLAFFTTLPVLFFYRSFENYYRLGPQEPLMLLFILLSLICLLNTKKKPRLKLPSWILMILALATKETAVFICPLLFLLALVKKEKQYWQLFLVSCLGAGLLVGARFLRPQNADYSTNYQLSISTFINTFKGYKAQFDSTWITSVFKISLVSFFLALVFRQDVKLSLIGLSWFIFSFGLLLPWQLVLGRYLLPVLPGLTLFIVTETKRQLDWAKKHWLFIILFITSAYYWSNFIFTNVAQSANVASGHLIREKANWQAVAFMAESAPSDSIVHINSLPDANYNEWIDQAENQLGIFHSRPDLKTNYLDLNLVQSGELVAEWSFFDKDIDLIRNDQVSFLDQICLSASQHQTLLKPALKEILKTRKIPSTTQQESWSFFRFN